MESHESGPRGLAICAASVFGLGGLIGLLPLLKILLESRFDQPAVLLLLIAYLATVLSMFGVMMVFVWKNPSESRVRPGKTSEGYAAPPSLRRVDTAQLQEPHQPPASVTDHTTRTLDHVPARRG